jgi:hypothetical protein
MKKTLLIMGVVIGMFACTPETPKECCESTQCDTTVIIEDSVELVIDTTVIVSDSVE